MNDIIAKLAELEARAVAAETLLVLLMQEFIRVRSLNDSRPPVDIAMDVRNRIISAMEKQITGPRPSPQQKEAMDRADDLLSRAERLIAASRTSD